MQIINKKNPWPKGWGQKTSIMGVINLTPDSFSDGGELNSSKKVLDQVNHFLSNGVDVIDLGAQSTRPGAEEVGSSVEIKRLIPYLKLIKSEFPDVLISIDTFNSEVAYEALLNGANWINDVTGGNSSTWAINSQQDSFNIFILVCFFKYLTNTINHPGFALKPG